ncbi:MAG: hypothetical protein WC303_02290 [Candidatus Paceibacterota bacterium]|jgi:hypothetical protein
MAKNEPTGDNARKGQIKGRSQVFNPRIEKFVKRDAKTGQFIDVKHNEDKFKGVRVEKGGSDIIGRKIKK